MLRAFLFVHVKLVGLALRRMLERIRIKESILSRRGKNFVKEIEN